MQNNTNDTMTPDDILAMKEELKAQIMQELKSDQAIQMEEQSQRRNIEKQEREEYVTKMKESPDPWVDIFGWVHTDQGVKVELEWNDPFVDYLRVNGVSGADDDQVVQKWVTLLLRDMADKMDDTDNNESDFS